MFLSFTVSYFFSDSGESDTKDEELEEGEIETDEDKKV